MSKKFLYTITTGRSGSVFLTELLKINIPAATVYHERMGYPHFGNTCPDAAHSTGFNTVGNHPFIQQFWQRKLNYDQLEKTDTFIEISHLLAKAGLIENLHLLPADSDIHLVALRREPFKIFWSFVNRFDFFNPGFTWLFTLDSRYKNKIIDSSEFKPYGMYGSAYWYVMEMFARMEYYKHLVADVANITFHEVELESLITPEGATKFLTDFTGETPKQTQIPGKKNATKHEFFGDGERQYSLKMIQRLQCDPAALGEEFYRSGERLGSPK